MATKTKKFEKTARAFLAEEGSLWAIVDALAEEMPGHVSASDLGECREYLASHGIEKEVDTIKSYRITGRYIEDSTPAQRRLFREQSVSLILRFARAGWPQDATVAAIREYQRETGRNKMPRDVASRLLSPRPKGDGVPPQDSSEDWTAEQWEAFDRKVVASAKTVITALNMWHRGEYTPSVEALAHLSLLKPQDLDAELANLVGQ